MPKTITEVSTYDDDFVVPDGDDWMDDAAQVVETIAQKCINSLRWLKDHTAKLDIDNVWQSVQEFQNVVAFRRTVSFLPNALDPYLSSTTMPANTWHPVGSFKYASGKYCNLYVGSQPDTLGSFAIVLNAFWRNAGGYAWQQQDTAAPSVALILRHGDVRIVAKDAGSAPWTSWQQNTLSAFGAEMLSASFRAARMKVTANTISDQTNGFRYTDAAERFSSVPLGELWGFPYWNSDGSVAQATTGFVAPEDRLVWIPIRVPPYCSFKELRIAHHQLQLNTMYDQFQLKRRVSSGAWANVGGVETRTSGGPFAVAVLHAGLTQTVIEAEEWAYTWKIVDTSGGSANNRIVGVELQWMDIGPSNRIG